MDVDLLGTTDGDPQDNGDPKQHPRGLVPISEHPFERQAQERAKQHDQRKQSPPFISLNGLFHICVALKIFALDHHSIDRRNHPLSAQDIGQLHIGLRGERAHRSVMFGQPVQAFLHIHFAFDPVIAKGRQAQALHRRPRAGTINQGANLGVD